MQGECGSSGLEFHLFLQEAQPLDLTAKTVTLYFTKPDGEKIFLPADVASETAPQGIAVVTFTAQCTAAPGLTKHGEVRVTDGDGSVLKFPAPTLFIEASNCENAVESTSEYHALDLALSEIQPSLLSMKSALSSMQSILDQIASAAQTAKENASLAEQKAQEAAASKDSASSSETSAVNQAVLAHQDALSASDFATTASTAAVTEINKQKGQPGGLASLGTDGKLNERLEYSHLDTLTSAFPPQSHTHSYSDLTGKAPFLPLARTHVSSMAELASMGEGHYLIIGSDTAGTPTNTNIWIINVYQEGWGEVAVAYGDWDGAIYITTRETNDNGKTFYWASWKKVF